MLPFSNKNRVEVSQQGLAWTGDVGLSSLSRLPQPGGFHHGKLVGFQKAAKPNVELIKEDLEYQTFTLA